MSTSDYIHIKWDDSYVCISIKYKSKERKRDEGFSFFVHKLMAIDVTYLDVRMITYFLDISVSTIV